MNEEESRKTVLELDLVSYSTVSQALEEHLDVGAVKEFEDKIQKFVDGGLESCGQKRADVVFGTAGDNALVVFDEPELMHKFANAVNSLTFEHNQLITVEEAKRWFRMGAATGEILINHSDRRIVGTVVKRAVRLESAASKGELIVDVATFEGLPESLKKCYGPAETLEVKGEIFQARRCRMIDVESPKPTKVLSYFGDIVFAWMELSPKARKKLGQSQLIKCGETRGYLLDLVDQAESNCALRAICGYKGDYSTLYYRLNFKKFKSISRIFSYEVMLEEIKTKRESYSLQGLRLHLNETETTAVEDLTVFLIPKGKRIKDLGKRNFNPPSSFGLAILIDKSNLPKKAVVHWEIDAEPLRHLIDVEGVVIDSGQTELLNELVKLHQSIANSDPVVSSKKEKSKIVSVCDELQKIWDDSENQRGNG